MLDVSVLGIRYHRLLVDSADTSLTGPLKHDYDYSFIVSYGDFNDAGYHCINKSSCMIDLSNGAEAAFAKFNSTSRNEVRRSDKIAELQFHQGYEDFGFDTYYDFHAGCEHDRNWYPVPPEELKNSLLFSATHNGTLIAGMSCYTHNNRIRVGRIYSNKRSKQSEVLNNLVYGCASKRIAYEICKYAAANGYISLDLGGADLSDPKKAGISQFKLSLGSEMKPVVLARWNNERFTQTEPQLREHGWDLT